MEGSTNYYDPKTSLQNLQNYINQLTACPIETIRETSTLKDLHNNRKPWIDSLIINSLILFPK